MAMVFPTSPTVGQVFTSGGRSWVWSGATWDSPTATNTLLAPYGLELIANQSFTAQSGINLDNIFSNKYLAYDLVISCTVGSETSIRMQLRGAGSTLSGTSYSRQQATFNNSSSTANSVSANPSWYICEVMPGPNLVNCQLINPFTNSPTVGNAMAATITANLLVMNGLYNSNAVSYDGIRLAPDSGTFTGTIQVYGRRL